MRICATALGGVFVIEPKRLEDDRGSFARSFDAEQLARVGFGTVRQCSASVTRRANTLRGMHYQAAPHAETKLVRCVRGAVFDVAVDLREDSPTRLGWFGVELSADNGRALLVGKGLAHGFLTLRDDCELLYMMDAPYVGAAAAGVRWDDPALAIDWPTVGGDAPEMVQRDAAYPDIRP